MEWRSRIVAHGSEAPDQLLANPRNWRIHPKDQQDALGSAIDQLGWIKNVVVNRTTGCVVDGHLRVGLAISRNEESVPVVYVELSEEEERAVIATFDPLAGLAETDESAYEALVTDLEGDGTNGDSAGPQNGTRNLLQALTELRQTRESGLPRPPAPDQPIVAICPTCAHEWEVERDG